MPSASFRDEEVGAAHVGWAHLAAAREDLPPRLVATPRIVNVTLPQHDRSLLGGLAVPPEA